MRPITSSPSAGSVTSSRNDGGAAHLPPRHEGKKLGPTLWRSSLLWRSYLVTFSLIGIAVGVGGWKGALLATGIGAVLLYWSIRNVISPLAAIARAAEAMALGSYDHRIAATEFDEAAISSLGKALNSISGDLAARLNAIAQEKKRR